MEDAPGNVRFLRWKSFDFVAQIINTHTHFYRPSAETNMHPNLVSIGWKEDHTSVELSVGGGQNMRV